MPGEPIRLRIFTFWRVAEPEKIFGRISEEVQKAAEVASVAGIRLVIENEESTNVGTGHELAKMLATLPPKVGANWDIGNGLWLGEVPYPDGYKTLDPKRIWNMHLRARNARRISRTARKPLPMKARST